MTKLTVGKESIRSLLENKKYIVPDYQRLYAWDDEMCEILWDDIVSFFSEHKDDEEEYYLGSLVTCKDKQVYEIIDGQQRITSFILLLRALYYKIERMTETERADIRGLKDGIEPCIWEVDPITKNVDKRKILIKSKVVTADDNEVFHTLLEDGKVNSGKTQYEKNYKDFLEKWNDYARDEPLLWKDFCVFILDRCILLPIECESFDTALTIFTTLNDRGLPLSDSDIFKSQLYQKQSDEESKQKFVEKWKELEEIVNEIREKLVEAKKASKEEFQMVTVFRYYSHYIRGNDRVIKKEIGLRKFYAVSGYKKLNNPNIMEDLIALSTFWSGILDREETAYISDKGRKYLQCLLHYPNEYWRYIVSVFFLKNRMRKNSKQELEKLLIKLTAFFYAKFIIKPTVNAIKDDVYRTCIALCHGEIYNLNIAQDANGLKDIIQEKKSSKIERGLLLLHAYCYDEKQQLLPEKFEIEHIFPRKWQDTNYNGWTREAADEYIDNIGNKVVLEKKLNTLAGNGYFLEKHKSYKKSIIKEVQALSRYEKPDWVQDDIEERETQVIDALVSFFNQQGVLKRPKN